MKPSIKIKNKRSDDPIDKLIFEKGLRIKNIILDKQLDLMIVVLNNGKVIRSSISEFPRLKVASTAQLNKWKLTGKGIGISWEDLDEDLSVKGFIKAASIQNIIHALTGSGNETIAVV